MGGGCGRSGSRAPPSTTGPILDSEEFSGLEPFFGIPGTVGGGLAMNAGAWGRELKDILLSITLMKEEGELVEKTSAETEIFLSEIGTSVLLDHSQRAVSAEKGKKRRDS